MSEHATVGPYRIVKAIGAGGSARIDLARIDRAYGFQRHVVIKRPLEHLRADPSVAASLRREAHLGGQLRHPNLVAVLDAGEHDGYDYLALEYIHGASLRTLMQPAGAETGAVRALPLGAALSIVIEVARGLHEAHELTAADGTSLGLVHRDVSPNNILLGADGTVKLADFGIAKDTRVSTLSGSMRGTVTYMAPEQCRGHAFDRRADVFSLGVILFELVTARRLFWADNDVASLHKVLSGVIPDPRAFVPGLAPDLAAVLLRAVAADPDARFATTALLADELEAFAVRSGVATGARHVARVVESELGVRGAPWIAPTPATAQSAAPHAEASLVGVIEATHDEPEADFVPVVVADGEPTIIDPSSFLVDTDRTIASPPLVDADHRPTTQRAATGAPPEHRPTTPPPASEAAYDARSTTPTPGADAAALAPSLGAPDVSPHQRRGAAAPLVIAQQVANAAATRRRRLIALAAIAVVATGLIAFAATRTSDEKILEIEDRGLLGPGSGQKKGSDPFIGRRPDNGAPRPNTANTGSDPISGQADTDPAIELEPAAENQSDSFTGRRPDADEAADDAKQRRRRRAAREAAAKAAADRAAAENAAVAPAPTALPTAAPRDAGTSNDAAPARVEWKPTLLLPTDDPKAPAKRRTP